jgi:hypothetical protein
MTDPTSSDRRGYSLADLHFLRPMEGWNSYSPMDRLERGRELQYSSLKPFPAMFPASGA